MTLQARDALAKFRLAGRRAAIGEHGRELDGATSAAGHEQFLAAGADAGVARGLARDREVDGVLRDETARGWDAVDPDRCRGRTERIFAQVDRDIALEPEALGVERGPLPSAFRGDGQPAFDGLHRQHETRQRFAVHHEVDLLRQRHRTEGQREQEDQGSAHAAMVVQGW